MFVLMLLIECYLFFSFKIPFFSLLLFLFLPSCFILFGHSMLVSPNTCIYIYIYIYID